MQPRIFSSIGLEHIVMKGNNGLPVFLDDEDKLYFLNLFSSKKSDSTDFISYCLMSNHIHLLIREKNPEKISKLIENIAKAYVKWFNEKYERKNSLFKKRFYNEPIESEIHLINVIRYIHNNPVAAGISKNPLQYEWSSCKEYLQNSTNPRINREYVSKIIDLNDLINYDFPTYVENTRVEKYFNSYEYVVNCVNEFANAQNINFNIYDIKKLNKEKQIEIIKFLCEEKKCRRESVKKVTGMSENYIYKLLRKEI